MKLAVFSVDGQQKVGRLSADETCIEPFALAHGHSHVGALLVIEQLLAGITPPLTGEAVPLDRVRLLAPIPRPRRNIFCVGKNYYEHAHEF
ncbi:MAG: DUF2437 domain-containing protein, partial [Gammaproteobacteria bacterium]|nr:DUF2437 domain-containing protein [Gammaproteobacteria bacterium]